MLSNQCELQYCRSSQHKKLVLYFPFSHGRHNGLFKGETYTYFRKVTTAFLSIRKQPSLRFKMFVCLTWVLHCICTVLFICVYLLSWHFVRQHSIWSHKLQDIKGRKLFESIIMTVMRSVHIKNHFGLDFSQQQILI